MDDDDHPGISLDQFHDPTLPIEQKVAIVGIGCRFPNNINNVSDFWRVISRGEDCMIPHPPDRVDPSYIYPGERLPGKIYALRGGYLSQDVRAFDREFFQISPDEASHMDPQQRVLLEVSWEALEDYGVDVGALRKSNTGVYIGVMNKEYIFQLSVPIDTIGQYSASGNNSNMLSNRVSYQFDFQGPSFTIDTACSSSMYAIHLACEAIRKKECNLALAGGVNLLLTPSPTVQLCQARMLSPDGRCKSFDKLADGYARGEGAGVLVLKPLRQALADGDKIYAVVRGGALNNDGKTKGITSPNPYSQESLLRLAYEAANVTPQDVPYVEAHGTGTQAGDVAESTSLGSVMAVGRREHQPPLVVGSVKSNFGHTEGAAGVASVIKTCLVLMNRQIPKVVHFRERNEKVDWNKYPIIFPTELMSWPKDAKLIAGCNGFGFGGANSHVVLEAAPEVKKSASETKENFFPTLLFLSADNKPALEKRVSDCINILSSPNMRNDVSLFRNVVQTAAVRTHHHQNRLAIYCESLEKTISILEERLKNAMNDKVMLAEGRIQKMPSDQIHKLVFVFSGMGTQWWAMGRQLIETDKTFRESITEIDAMLKEYGATWSLLNMLTEEMDQEKINNTEIAQPAICAVQISLAAVYRKLGIYPKAVVGHSVGEVAAACVAGYLSVEDAMRLIFVRGRTLQRTAGSGKMAAVLAPAALVKDKLSDPKYIGKIDIACVNGPSQTVISGDGDAIESCIASFKLSGVRCVMLKVQNAFHSYQQEAVKEHFLQGTKFLRCPKFHTGDQDAAVQVPMISTVSGSFLNAKTLNTNVYWWQNIRQTVEFVTSLNTLFARGFNVFLEIGPHPSLASVIKGSMVAFKDKNPMTSFHETHAVISSLRRPSDRSVVANDKANILLSIAKLHVQGYPIDLESLFLTKLFDVAKLPNYPWQHQIYETLPNLAKKVLHQPRKSHPLIGKQIKVLPFSQNGTEDKIWKSKYNRTDVPWLHHHKIQNVVVLPGAAFIEMMLTVSKQNNPDASLVVIENVNFHKFHYSPDSEGLLYTTQSRNSDDDNTFQITVRTYDEKRDSMSLNATCEIKTTGSKRMRLDEYLNVDDIKGRLSDQYPVESLYKRLAIGGVEIGELFGAVTSAHLSDDRKEILFTSALPEALKSESDLYIFHPALLDSVFQLFAAFSLAKEGSGSRGVVEVPKSVGYLCIHGHAPPKLAIHAQKKQLGPDVSVTVKVADLLTGKVVAVVGDVQLANIGVKDEPCITIWQKTWDQVTTADMDDRDVADVTPPEHTQSKAGICYIVPDKLGMTEALVKELAEVSVFSPEGVHVTDMSNSKFPLPCEEHYTTENVIILSMLDDCSDTSLLGITKDRFIHSQSHLMVKLIQNVIETFQKRQTRRIWIVTKGGMLVHSHDKDKNPLMAKAHALVLTMVQETPKLFISAIDLPYDLPSTDCARWLSHFLNNPILTENCIALRSKRDHTESNHAPYSAYASRLSTKRSTELAYMNPCHEWMVNLQEVSQRVDSFPIKSLCSTSVKSSDNDCESLGVKVNVNAYVQQSYKDFKRQKESNLGFLFVGSLPKSDSYDSEHVVPIEDTKQSKMSKFRFLFARSVAKCSSKSKMNESVLGYCRSHIVTSTVKARMSDLISLPSNVGNPADALSVVKHCLPFYLAIQKIKSSPQNGKPHSLLLASRNCDIHLKFAVKLAESQNFKITMLVESIAEQTRLSGNSKSVKVVTKDSVDHEVESSSVDTFVLDSGFTLEDKLLDRVLEKISVLGTITLTDDVSFNKTKCDSKQIHVIAVDTQVMLSNHHQHFTSSLIESLLHLMFDSGCRNVSVGPFENAVSLGEATPDDLLGEGIVTSPPEISLPLDFSNYAKQFSINTDASYLVVGGTKGIGFKIAQWLASLGAKMVYVSGRNTPSEEICKKIDVVKSIKFIKCDITDEANTAAMLTYIRNHIGYPLQGIFHCAAVFADQLLKNATKEKWDEILLPKAYGALLLHQLTLKMNIELTQFVVLSSTIEYLGNEGQGNYCVANAFITSLCESRRLQGLPATVIAPSAITEVGYAARKGFNSIFDAQGILSVTPEQVLEGMSWALMTDTTFCGLTGEFDKIRYVQNAPSFSHKNETDYRFSVLKKEISKEDLSNAFSMGLDNQLSNCRTPVEGKALITSALVGFVKERLGVTNEISTGLSFTNYGLDSGMSFELSNLMKTQFGVTISSVELLNDTLNIGDIVPLIYNRSTSRNRQADVKIQKEVSLPETAWFEEPVEVKNARFVLLCFPYTGKGSTMFVDWAEQCKNIGVRLLVAQLPGWEGRPNEKPSRDIEEIIREFCACLIPKIKGKHIAVIGCGFGSLIAFEIIRRLQAGDDISVVQFNVIGGLAPSIPYESIMANVQERRGAFLDNRDLRQTLPLRNATFNAQASEEISQTYKYVSAPQLRCNVTVFSGKYDIILYPEILENWGKEVHDDYTFENFQVEIDHKLLRNEISKRDIFTEICKSLDKKDEPQPLKKIVTRSNSASYRRQRSIEFDDDATGEYLRKD